MASSTPESSNSDTLRTPATLERLPEIFEFCGGFADAHGFPDAKRFTLEVCIEEIVTNVMKYGYPADGPGLVEISLVLESDTLTITVADEGVPFDPTQAPDVDTTLPLEDRPIGGLGLHMVRKMMDEVHYRREDGRNLLTMVCKIR